MRKKEFYWLLVVVLAFSGCAMSQKATTAKDWQTEVRAIIEEKPVAEASADVLDADKSVISVQDKGNRVYFTITNPRLTPKGNTKGKGLKPAVKVKMASGVLASARRNPYFTLCAVKDNKITFNLPNFARAKNVNVPVVEHIWGYAQAADGTVGYLVLDPNDPWVCYEAKTFGGYKTKSGDKKADLGTLAIGSVMYQDGPTVSLKSLGKGKLKQGRHPELAKIE